jgi:hypothetical protein
VSKSFRLLFIPVSSARGTGEYARSVAIAHAAKARWPTADIRFMVSSEAPYANQVPFPAEVLPRSPTFHPKEVAAHIRAFRPNVVLFDNAGRTEHLLAARAVGAKLVFVSSRERQRGKAFRWRWMRMLDEHWIAYPAVVAGELSLLERIKVGALKRPTIRYLEVLLPPVAPELIRSVPARLGVTSGEYVLVVAGGGTAHRSVRSGPEKIARAATLIAQRGHTVLLVGIPADRPTPPAALHLTPLVPMPELIALIQSARLVLTNGADTLLQVLALRRPCVAVSLSPDQTLRLRRLADAGVDVEVPLAAESIAARACELLEGVTRIAHHLAVHQQIELHDGLQTAVDALATLLDESAGETQR